MAGYFSHMIQMSVQEEKLFPDSLSLKIPQVATRSQAASQPFTYGIHIFGQPEITTRLQSSKRSFIDNRSIFTFGLSIFPTNTDIGIFRQTCQKIRKLVIQYFLRSKDIRIIKFNQISQAKSFRLLH